LCTDFYHELFCSKDTDIKRLTVGLSDKSDPEEKEFRNYSEVGI
jgi:hypothetical protein